MIHHDPLLGIAASRLQYIVQVCAGYILVLPGPGFGHFLSNTIAHSFSLARFMRLFVWRWATCQQFKACCKTGGAPILVESAKRSNVSAPAAKVRRHISSIQEFECQDVPREVCQIQMDSRSNISNMYRPCTGLKKFCERLESKRGCSASSSIVQHTSDRPDRQ